MKRSIMILILSFFFINNLDSTFSKLNICFNDKCTQAIEQGEYFCKINIDIENLNHKDNALDKLCQILHSNGVNSELSGEDVLRDIEKSNTATIYYKQIHDTNHIVVDMRMNNISKINEICVEEQRMSKIYSDIKEKLGDNLSGMHMTKNIKVDLKKEYSIEYGKNMIEKYLSKLSCEFKSENIKNGYAIEAMAKITDNNKFLISVAKYKDKVVIIYGEPYIYISY